MFKIFNPFINILVGVLLAGVFFAAGQNIIETFPVARMTALNYLRPYPMDYFWELNIHHAPLDRNKIRSYADYYEHLLQAFPGFRDSYGLLGYCYHYLNNDPKAIRFLKKAIEYYPDYFWNYYNLAAIYINESRYKEASDVLQKALSVNPMNSLRTMLVSQVVYGPLLGTNQKEVFIYSAQHLNEMYRVSFLLEQILRHGEQGNDIQGMIKRIHPELYAF